MNTRPPLQFSLHTLDQMTIDDEISFRHVGLYSDLKKLLRDDGYRFRVLPPSLARWDHAVFLGLTFGVKRTAMSWSTAMCPLTWSRTLRGIVWLRVTQAALAGQCLQMLCFWRSHRQRL